MVQGKQMVIVGVFVILAMVAVVAASRMASTKNNDMIKSHAQASEKVDINQKENIDQNDAETADDGPTEKLGARAGQQLNSKESPSGDGDGESKDG